MLNDCHFLEDGERKSHRDYLEGTNLFLKGLFGSICAARTKITAQSDLS